MIEILVALQKNRESDISIVVNCRNFSIKMHLKISKGKNFSYTLRLIDYDYCTCDHVIIDQYSLLSMMSNP